MNNLIKLITIIILLYINMFRNKIYNQYANNRISLYCLEIKFIINMQIIELVFMVDILLII